jgi:transcriptional regulator with XRE-family HTH domain
MHVAKPSAANLRRLRHAKGLSQENLVDEAEVNRSSLSKVEKGETYAGWSRLLWRARRWGSSPVHTSNPHYPESDQECRTGRAVAKAMAAHETRPATRMPVPW